MFCLSRFWYLPATCCLTLSVRLKARNPGCWESTFPHVPCAVISYVRLSNILDPLNLIRKWSHLGNMKYISLILESSQCIKSHYILSNNGWSKCIWTNGWKIVENVFMIFIKKAINLVHKYSYVWCIIGVWTVEVRKQEKEQCQKHT